MLDVPGVERSRRSAALGWAGPVETRGGAGPVETRGGAGPVETRGGAGPVETRGGAGLGLECRALI